MLILFSTGVPAFVPFRVHFQYSLSCTEDLVRMYRSAVTFYLNFKISQRIFRKLLSVGVSCAQKTMLNANISVFQNFLQKSFVGKFWILAPPKILVPRRPCSCAKTFFNSLSYAFGLCYHFFRCKYTFFHFDSSAHAQYIRTVRFLLRIS